MTWVKVGIPNSHVDTVEAITDNIESAKYYSSGGDFVRVDLYDTNKGPMIGELTFISMSGFGPFTKKEYDFKYGKYFDETKIFKNRNVKL